MMLVAVLRITMLSTSFTPTPKTVAMMTLPAYDPEFGDTYEKNGSTTRPV
jgi:hypothetical protein